MACTSPCLLLSAERDKMFLYESHQDEKMMIMMMKTPGSQIDSPVAEGSRREGGGGEMRDLHQDT